MRRGWKCGRFFVRLKVKATLGINKDDPKDEVIAKAKAAIADKLTGNIVKEIYVPGRLVNIVMK